jgi:hypothetical protein
MSITKVTGMMQTSTKGGDISSASPCVIDTDGDYFDVSGTTNFAAFTVVAGRRFTIQFDGVLTMTHHATNLDLPGGANITTAAGDVGEFFATGTNTVQCVNYTKADGTAVVAAGGGAWTLIGTVTGGAATYTVTGLDTTYDKYAVSLSNLNSDYSGSEKGNIRLGTSGGIISSSASYKQSFIRSNSTQDDIYGGSGSATYIQAGEGSMEEDATGGWDSMFYIDAPQGGQRVKVYGITAWTWSDSSNVGQNFFAGILAADATVDRVQVLFNTGAISSGRMTVWGIAHA